MGWGVEWSCPAAGAGTSQCKSFSVEWYSLHSLVSLTLAATCRALVVHAALVVKRTNPNEAEDLKAILGTTVGEGEVEALMREFDHNDDGKIDFQ